MIYDFYLVATGGIRQHVDLEQVARDVGDVRKRGGAERSEHNELTASLAHQHSHQALHHHFAIDIVLVNSPIGETVPRPHKRARYHEYVGLIEDSERARHSIVHSSQQSAHGEALFASRERQSALRSSCYRGCTDGEFFLRMVD